MIEKIILNPDKNLTPAILKWSDEKEDYVIDVPNGISRADLIAFINEVKRITQWENV